jgi:hypothetical protein
LAPAQAQALVVEFPEIVLRDFRYWTGAHLLNGNNADPDPYLDFVLAGGMDFGISLKLGDER